MTQPEIIKEIIKRISEANETAIQNYEYCYTQLLLKATNIIDVNNLVMVSERQAKLMRQYNKIIEKCTTVEPTMYHDYMVYTNSMSDYVASIDIEFSRTDAYVDFVASIKEVLDSLWSRYGEIEIEYQGLLAENEDDIIQYRIDNNIKPHLPERKYLPK
jgi:hypothetical protein